MSPTPNQDVCSKQNIISLSEKPKKIRKSSECKEYDKEGLYAVLPRDDIQSPAYSDISDDSTPINELNGAEKYVEKKCDINKKKNDSSSICNESSSEHPLTSTLGNFGVYQFYQAQPFVIQPQSSDHSQHSKTNLATNPNQAISALSGNQHHSPNLEFCKKKEQVDDILVKNSAHNQPAEITNESNQSQANNMSVMSGMISPATTAPSKPASHFYGFK